MSTSSNQKPRSEGALEKKKDARASSGPDRPDPGQTAHKGMHPVEREKPITPEEKTKD